jgi:hypothetical protein
MGRRDDKKIAGVKVFRRNKSCVHRTRPARSTRFRTGTPFRGRNRKVGEGRRLAQRQARRRGGWMVPAGGMVALPRSSGWSTAWPAGRILRRLSGTCWARCLDGCISRCFHWASLRGLRCEPAVSPNRPQPQRKRGSHFCHALTDDRSPRTVEGRRPMPAIEVMTRRRRRGGEARLPEEMFGGSRLAHDGHDLCRSANAFLIHQLR